MYCISSNYRITFASFLYHYALNKARISIREVQWVTARNAYSYLPHKVYGKAVSMAVVSLIHTGFPHPPHFIGNYLVNTKLNINTMLRREPPKGECLEVNGWHPIYLSPLLGQARSTQSIIINHNLIVANHTNMCTFANLANLLLKHNLLLSIVLCVNEVIYYKKILKI